MNVLEANLKMLIQAILREEAAKIISKFQKTKTITLIDEHSLRNRSLWYSLKKNGTRVVAIQHGGISSGNLAYKFNTADKAYQPLPDLTLIRGEFTKSMLINDSIYNNKKRISSWTHENGCNSYVIKKTQT